MEVLNNITELFGDVENIFFIGIDYDLSSY
jgi:hypothetical protein